MNNQPYNPGKLTGEDKIHLIAKYLNGTYSHLLGLEIIEYQNGFCKGRLALKKEFYNPLGVIHGGLLYTIADTIGGIAATRFESGDSVTTVSGSMDFMRPVRDVDVLYTEAKIIKDGKRIVFVDARVYSEDNTLYNKASFTFARITLPERENAASKQKI